MKRLRLLLQECKRLLTWPETLEKKMISLKTPLNELVVLSADADLLLKDIDSLKGYISDELRCEKYCVITSDEASTVLSTRVLLIGQCWVKVKSQT